MKAPMKVIEKISLPLMFVTFAMAVLMLAVGRVSAHAECGRHDDCCDLDGKGVYKHSETHAPTISVTRMLTQIPTNDGNLLP